MNNNYGYPGMSNIQDNSYSNNYSIGPKQQVVKVSGKQGVEMYRIGPNSSALLLDESGQLVWLVTTDGAGYKSIYPYDISPHVDPPDPHISELEQRMARMEELLNGIAVNFAATKSATNNQPTESATNSGATTTTTTITNQF